MPWSLLWRMLMSSLLCTGSDPPWGADHWIPADPRFTHAIDLVKYIRSNPEFKDYFCIGVAGTKSSIV